MRFVLTLAAIAMSLGMVPIAAAQTESKDDAPSASEAASEYGPRLGKTEVHRWRIGMIIKAEGGPLGHLTGTTTVPMDWPEQHVTVVSKDLSPGVTIKAKSYETARQMAVSFSRIAEGQEARAILVLDIERRVLLPPERTDVYVVPDAKSLKTMKDYLGPSPYIESSDPRIKDFAKKIGSDQPKAWQHVRTIYDWVRGKIQYEKDAPLVGCLTAIDQGKGDCNELTSTFIALCRASGIPARTVRIPGHCYPEFYLLDPKGKGHWFPAEASGSDSFGGIPSTAPIMQKGDNIRISGKPNRFLPETIAGSSFPGGGQPQMKLVCEPVK